MNQQVFFALAACLGVFVEGLPRHRQLPIQISFGHAGETAESKPEIVGDAAPTHVSESNPIPEFLEFVKEKTLGKTPTLPEADNTFTLSNVVEQKAEPTESVPEPNVQDNAEFLQGLNKIWLRAARTLALRPDLLRWISSLTPEISEPRNEPLVEDVQIAEETQPEPTVEETQPDSIVEEIQPESVVDFRQEHIVEVIKPEQIIEEIQPESVVEVQLEPIIEMVQFEPIVDAQPENNVEETGSEPIVEEVQPEPIVEEVQLEPIVEEVQPEPIVEEVQPEPIVEEVQPEPIVEEVQPEPIVEEVQPEPIVEEVQPEVILEIPAEMALELLPEVIEEVVLEQESATEVMDLTTEPAISQLLEVEQPLIQSNQPEPVNVLAEPESKQSLTKLKLDRFKERNFKKGKTLFSEIEAPLVLSHFPSYSYSIRHVPVHGR